MAWGGRRRWCRGTLVVMWHHGEQHSAVMSMVGGNLDGSCAVGDALRVVVVVIGDTARVIPIDRRLLVLSDLWFEGFEG